MKKFAITSIILMTASIVLAQSSMGDMKGMDMAKKPAVSAKTAY